MDELQIPKIVAGERCGRHSAARGVPCWWIWPLSGRRRTPAVCNQRAKAAGYDAPIDPRSLRRN